MALIDRIKYDGPSPGIGGKQIPWLVYKFPSEELGLGSQLIVNESQEAVFLKGGDALDIFGPGRHTLSTANLPLLRRLINLPFGGKTPFTAEIYFVNKAVKLDMKWGTTDPFQVTEPRYQIIVRVRSFGQFGISISDSRNFVKQIVGALHSNQVSDYQTVSKYFKGLVLTKVKDTIASIIVDQKISVLDITASLDAISTTCRERVTDEFDRFGIDVLNFFVESINIPEEDLARVKSILEQRAEFDILGDERYTRKRSFDILETAASNEGTGGAALGLGLGLGAGAGAGRSMADLTKQINTAPLERANSAEKGVKCPKCGAESPPNAKFCSDCGEELDTKPITCQKCKTDNPPGSKFCNNCGSSLQKVKCPKCDFENAPDSRFCSNCGSRLGE